MDYQALENQIFDFFTSKEKLLKVIGVDDELHYNYLLKQLVNKINSMNMVLLYDNGIPIPSNIQVISMVQSAVDTMNLNHLDQEDIALTNQPIMNHQIKQAIMQVLQPRLLQPFKSQNVKNNFFVKQIVWLYEFVNQAKRILVYYGTPTDEDIYLLQMLYLLDFRILYLNSFHDENIGVGKTLNLSGISPMKPLKTRVRESVEELPERSVTGQGEGMITTWAGEAKEELYNTLYDQHSILRPWQFKKWTTKAIPFNAVIEDLGTYWKEDAKLRPEFKAENGVVTVPHFFTKVNGVYSDLEKYANWVEELKSADLTMFFTDTSLFHPSYDLQSMYSLSFVSDQTQKIQPDVLKKHALYRLAPLNDDVEDFMIKKLNEFWEVYGKQLELRDFIELIANVITLDEPLLRQIENFDYPFKIPKFIFYLYNRDGFDKATGCLLQYFNLIGMDLIFLSPTGTDSMEEWTFRKPMNIIQLDEMKFDLQYDQLKTFEKKQKKKSGFFASLFG